MRDFDFENDQWIKLPSHLKHLPLFTRHFDFLSYLIRLVWAMILKGWFTRFYIRLKLHGEFDSLYQKHPKLIIISNHTSHLDAVCIAASIPFRFWGDLFIAAARDYFFTNPLFTFFSQHCLGAIPINRKGNKSESLRLIEFLLTELERMWLIIFPEGTRSPDGTIQSFKKGIAIFSQKANVPILCLYIHGGYSLWPKGRIFAKPGKLDIFVGPVIPPKLSIKEIESRYKTWIGELISTHPYFDSLSEHEKNDH